jgi:hypothetical protein
MHERYQKARNPSEINAVTQDVYERKFWPIKRRYSSPSIKQTLKKLLH